MLSYLHDNSSHVRLVAVGVQDGRHVGVTPAGQRHPVRAAGRQPYIIHKTRQILSEDIQTSSLVRWS